MGTLLASFLAFAGMAAEAGSKSELKLELIDPRSLATSVGQERVNILGRTVPEARVTIGGQEAKVFATGIFVRDQVPVGLGVNRIAIVATTEDGERAECVLTITRTNETPASALADQKELEIVATSIEPSQDVFLTRGDGLDLSFRGTPGCEASYRMGGVDWQPIPEVIDPGSGKGSGVYRTTFSFGSAGVDSEGKPVEFRLSKKDVKAGQASETQALSKGRVGTWDEARIRLATVKEDGAALVFGMHEVRLGGPYLSELPAGTVLRITGMRGGNYRVQLTPQFEAWISIRDVELAPKGTAVPHLAFTSISVSGSESGDTVTIPYPARVPFSVEPGVSQAGRASIAVDFYGAHNAATWLTHAKTAKVIREVKVNQLASDHLRVLVELHDQQLWGYRWTVTNGTFRLLVRGMPNFAAPPASPLSGLTIALEPGHGGGNSGARGVSGSLEKDINRMAVSELSAQLQKAGAKTVIVREGDEDLGLSERARRAAASGAHLFISLHANSAGHALGYLRVSGTSTYYKWSFSRDFADAIHSRLLEFTKLDDFGNVGNFNYSPIRVNTWMPAMLVEQAFMSNPEDEAKMLDPEFRRKMMQAVVLGTEDWLKTFQSKSR